VEHVSRELSVALCRGNALLIGASMRMLALAAGQRYGAGLDVLEVMVFKSVCAK